MVGISLALVYVLDLLLCSAWKINLELTLAVRDTIGSTIYFITYESCKQLLANSRGNSPTSPLAVVVAGGLCGLVSWVCVREVLYFHLLVFGYLHCVTCLFNTSNSLAVQSGADNVQIYPIDSAKSIYQKNALDRILPGISGEPPRPPDAPIERPKMEWFSRRMYQGLGVSMARTSMINATFFSVFEFIKKSINRMDVDEEDS